MKIYCRPKDLAKFAGVSEGSPELRDESMACDAALFAGGAIA